MERSALYAGVGCRENSTKDIHAVVAVAVSTVDGKEIVIHTPRGTTRTLATPIDKFLADFS